MPTRLLLADESITIRKVVQIIFRNTNTEVSTAGNRMELLSLAKTLNPDVILLSVNFPGIDLQTDVKTMSELPGKNPIPVVLMANRGESIDSTYGQGLGADGILYKPLDNRELKRAVDHILRSSLPSTQPSETAHKTPPKSKEKPKQTPPNEPLKIVTPAVNESQTGTPEQRARVLMDIFESYLNENVILLTDALAKHMAPRIASDVAGKILESIDFSSLPSQVATIIEGVIQDLVPQLAETLIQREIDMIKEEAAHLISRDEQSED